MFDDAAHVLAQELLGPQLTRCATRVTRHTNQSGVWCGVARMSRCAGSLGRRGGTHNAAVVSSNTGNAHKKDGFYCVKCAIQGRAATARNLANVRSTANSATAAQLPTHDAC